jgi:transcriptional regulator with XRE-family HTH domain
MVNNKIDSVDKKGDDAGDFATYSKRLQYVIDSRKITQKKLAKLAEVTEQTVYRWMRKGIAPGDGALKKISDETEVSLLWLKEGIGPKKRSAVWGYYARQSNIDLYGLSKFYDRLNEILSAKKISKEQLSAITNITINDGDWWVGTGEAVRPTVFDIERIATATGYDKNWIWYGTGNKLTDEGKELLVRELSLNLKTEQTIPADSEDNKQPYPAGSISTEAITPPQNQEGWLNPEEAQKLRDMVEVQKRFIVRLEKDVEKLEKEIALLHQKQGNESLKKSAQG